MTDKLLDNHFAQVTKITLTQANTSQSSGGKNNRQGQVSGDAHKTNLKFDKASVHDRIQTLLNSDSDSSDDDCTEYKAGPNVS